MSNKSETTYTNRIKNNFFTLTIPPYIRGSKEAASTAVETRDLADRRRQKDELLKTRGETSTAYAKAQDDLDHFQKQVQDYQLACNVRNPSANDRALIATVTRSVSTIRLTGPSHGVSDLDRRIAGRATALIKSRDDAMAAWNEAGEVSF